MAFPTRSGLSFGDTGLEYCSILFHLLIANTTTTFCKSKNVKSIQVLAIIQIISHGLLIHEGAENYFLTPLKELQFPECLSRVSLPVKQALKFAFCTQISSPPAFGRIEIANANHTSGLFLTL